jgi:hypothetical protein
MRPLDTLDGSWVAREGIVMSFNWKEFAKNTFSTCEEKAVILDPVPGSGILECIRVASVVALAEDVVVKFSFNDTGVEIDPREITARAYNQWAKARGHAVE